MKSRHRRRTPAVTWSVVIPYQLVMFSVCLLRWIFSAPAVPPVFATGSVKLDLSSPAIHTWSTLIDLYSPTPTVAIFISTYKSSKGTRGHIQIGTLLRRVGVKKAAGGETETNGWVLTLTGRLSTIGRDSFGFGGTVGDGIGSYAAGLATSPAAAGPTLAGGLKAKRVLGGYGGYMRVWSPQFRSTVSYGYIQVDPTTGQTGSAVKNTQNFLGNLVWTPQRGVGIGLEYIYGRRENNDGTKGTDP